MKTIKTLILVGALTSVSACSAITDFTSSTSSTLDAATPDITLNNFIDKRYDAIRRDAAAGGGENIEALANLMGQQNAQSLALWMQANYGKLFTEQKPENLLSRIEQYRLQDNG